MLGPFIFADLAIQSTLNPWWQSVATALAASIFTATWALAIDWHRRVIETRHLGLAIGAEVTAIRGLLADMIEHGPNDPEFLDDTFRYTEADRLAAPITRAAAAKAGQFPAAVAVAVGDFVSRMDNLVQQTRTVREMQKDKALTEQKLAARRDAIRPFAKKLVDSGLSLADAVERQYGKYR